MGTRNQEQGIFSNTQVLYSCMIAGPYTAGNLLACNFRFSRSPVFAILARLSGIICTILMYYVITKFSDTWLNSGSREAWSEVLMIKIIIAFTFHVFYTGISWIVLIKGLFCRPGAPTVGNRELAGYVFPGLAMTMIFLLTGPFFFFFLMIYILPNIYIYNSVSLLFNTKAGRTIFVSMFLILTCAFPVGEILMNTTSTGIFKFYLLTGYFYLPFTLYFFLLLIVYHSFKGLNKFLKLLPVSYFESRRIVIALILFFVTISAIIVAIGHINFNNTRIIRYTIEVPRKSSKLNHLKIAMAADFHIYELTKTSFMDQFVDKINLINADIVLLPGDIVEDAEDIPHMAYFKQKFKNIRSKYGIYASPGNHEHYGRSGEKFDFFKESDIKLLKDTIVLLDNSFYLAGRSDDHDLNHKSSEFLLTQAFDSLPVILLYHRPTGFNLVTHSKIDIQLSGHSHNGQLWPFNYVTDVVYELPHGYRKFNNTHVFVTSGAQGWGPPVRVGGYSEIMEIDVNFK
jgi:uncharacterized protein